MIEALRAILLLTGSIFIFIGALGIFVMPDVLTRAHAISKALTLGICLMLLSLLMSQTLFSYSTKVFLAIAFQFFTIPLATHIFALYAYTTRKSPSSSTE